MNVFGSTCDTIVENDDRSDVPGVSIDDNSNNNNEDEESGDILANEGTNPESNIINVIK